MGNRKADLYAYKSESYPVRETETKRRYPEVTLKVGSNS